MSGARRYRHWNLSTFALFKKVPLVSICILEYCTPTAEQTVQESTRNALRVAGYDPPSPSRSLLVNVDNVWFLRGILSFSTLVNNNSVAMYTDFSDAEVLRWLSKTRDFMGKPTVSFMGFCNLFISQQGMVDPLFSSGL